MAQVTAQGVTDRKDPPPNYDDAAGVVGNGALAQASGPVIGGGGGGGGGGADAGGDGQDGQDASGQDGADGPDDVAEGGKGGNAGTSGQAYGRAQSQGTNQLNPDMQLCLEWSWLHNQDANLEVSGGGGGGRGEGNNLNEL